MKPMRRLRGCDHVYTTWRELKVVFCGRDLKLDMLVFICGACLASLLDHALGWICAQDVCERRRDLAWNDSVAGPEVK